MLRSNSKSLGSPEEEKEGCGGKDLQKRIVKPGMKEWVVMEN